MQKKGDLDFDEECGKCPIRVPTRNLCKLKTETNEDLDDGVHGAPNRIPSRVPMRVSVRVSVRVLK